MKKIINFVLLLTILSSFVLLFGIKNVDAYDTTTGNDEDAQRILNTFYHEGVYKKETTINLTDPAKAEVVKMFHASCNHLVRITYYDGEEIWMTNEEGTINSGYETVDGNMLHFKKIDDENVYDYTVENTITTEYYQTLKNLKETTGWQLNNGAYYNDHETVIDQFRQFVAPLWLATEEAKNYIVFTQVKMFEVTDKLHIQLLTSSTDAAKVTKGEVFAEAVISIDRPEKELVINRVYAYAANYTHLYTNVDVKETDNYDVYLIDEEGTKHIGTLFNYISKESQFNFSTYNKVNSGNYTVYLTLYASDAIYKGSALIKQGVVITLDGYKIEKVAVAEGMPASLDLSSNLYDDLGWAQIQLFVQNAKAAINASESFDEIDVILDELKEDILSVEFKQFDASELIAIYQEKVDKVLDNISSEDYSVENYTLITNAASTAKENIALETDEERMQSIVDELSTYISTIDKLAITLQYSGAWNPHGGRYVLIGWQNLPLPDGFLNSAESKANAIVKLIASDGTVYEGVINHQDGAMAVILRFDSYGDAGFDVANLGFTVYFKFVYNGNVYEVSRTC